MYGQAASNLVAGNNLEVIVQQILDMGGGSWDRDTVLRALRAAFNNPERAVEYLYSVSTQTLISWFYVCYIHIMTGSSSVFCISNSILMLLSISFVFCFFFCDVGQMTFLFARLHFNVSLKTCKVMETVILLQDTRF